MLLAAAAVTLAAFTPLVVHDADERFPLAAAQAGHEPAAYGRAVPASDGGTWLQYWLYYPYQDQDRGIVRTGRHEGDWELVQYRVDGRLREAVYAQHSGAERCEAREIEFRAGRPVVYAAHGSHASYLHAGVRDRLWPDPNDEADGRGRASAPSVVEVTATDPPFMARPEPWGGSRANPLVPLEQTSPLGPAFQPDRWDPDRLASDARDCRADCDEVGECDGPEKAMTAAAVGAGVLGLVWLRRRRPGRPPGDARA